MTVIFFKKKQDSPSSVFSLFVDTASSSQLLGLRWQIYYILVANSDSKHRHKPFVPTFWDKMTVQLHMAHYSLGFSRICDSGLSSHLVILVGSLHIKLQLEDRQPAARNNTAVRLTVRAATA